MPCQAFASGICRLDLCPQRGRGEPAKSGETCPINFKMIRLPQAIIQPNLYQSLSMGLIEIGYMYAALQNLPK